MYRSWLLYYLTIPMLAHILLSSGVYGKNKIVCKTPYCEKLATEFLQNRNTAVDPCENYHEYACGSWLKHNPMPDYETSWSQLRIMQHNVNKRLRDLLLEEEKDTDIPPVKGVKKYYRSCLDTERIEKDGIRSFLEILSETGGWPMAMPKNAWDERKKKWQEIDTYYYQFLGYSTFYELSTYSTIVENSTKNTLTISPNPELPLCNIAVVDKLNTTRSAYVKGIIRVALHFANESGFDLNTTELATDIVDMLLFEIKLIKLISSGLNDDGNFEDMDITSLDTLQKWYDYSTTLVPDGKINFKHLNDALFLAADVNLEGYEVIITVNKIFFVKLAELLHSTPKRVIVNYINWNLIFAFLPYLTPTMTKIKDDMSNEEFGVRAHPPRWLSCVKDMKMKDVASYMYLERYLTLNVTAKSVGLTKTIQDELENRAENATGLPSKLKDFLKTRLHKITNSVGAANWYRDAKIITEQYDGLTMTDDFFENVVRFQKFVSLRLLKEIRKPSRAEPWIAEPTTVDAYYKRIANEIIIPGADLQEPFLTKSLPEAVNYGYTGIFIGHELAHAIDISSIKYNTEGELFNWRDSELKEYNEKAMCFVNQYNSYISDVKDDDGSDLHLNGTRTLEENMADTTGLEGAYLAFKNLQKILPYEVKLPGLESLSDDELFFLSFANFGCFWERPEVKKYVVKHDVHSPFNYRIIGTVSNLPQFAKVYNCPIGSPMNPEKKCKIFD